MITPKDLRSLISRVQPELKEIIEEQCFSQFTFLEAPPKETCQYWKIEFLLLGDEVNSISRCCGYFRGEGEVDNPELSINQFFQNNDRLMEECILLSEQEIFSSLLPYLKEGKELSGLDSVMFTVEACIRGGNEWMKSLCQETVFILHENEDGHELVDIGCQQSERYKIKTIINDKVLHLWIPFNSVDLFPDAERVEGCTNMTYFQYQVALSFAGEDRAYVSKLAHSLRQKDIRVFYDDYEQVELWGKDLYVHLDEVYRKKARFCVLFLSEHYKKKVWTNHERESAQARAFEEKKGYVLPVRMDDTEIPGIRPTIGYVDGRSISPGKLAGLIQKKLFTFD